MPDMLLVFPPQWSPFQPALSLPSLSSWLKGAGFTVTSRDLNVRFYEWLLSDECASLLIEKIGERGWDDDVQAAYRATFAKAGDFRADIERLRSPRAANTESPAGYSARNYLMVKSFETYLEAASTVAGEFVISPYEFRLASGNLNVEHLQHRVANPPNLLEAFVRTVVFEEILPTRAAVIGLSCIGQEQLYFTLLLGHLIKQHSDSPVLVGGTIFSRIFERGVLKEEWFGRYFDLIVRNEGEKPATGILANARSGRPLVDGVPGVVYRGENGIVSSEPAPPLTVAELPVPDFDDLPLGRYISSDVTLPLLSARGCYWGKCEFCHHGMVYGEKFAPYKPANLLQTVRMLSDRYGVTHFAFNDEALPPTSAKAIGATFPPHDESGWTFTGLIKFEPYYSREIFEGLHRAGFRSLYVGLESASERVLELMRKRSKRETIVANLTDATQAQIWMHCFLFFGFPGETDDEARETFDFIVHNSDIVSSFGAGTFSLEHNAPISHHLEKFGLRLLPARHDDVDVYYEYDVDSGISAARALEWQERLTEATALVPNYVAARWIPRELLLCMLSAMTPDELREVGLSMRECGGFPAATRLRDVVSSAKLDDDLLIVNRINGRVIVLRRDAAELFELCRTYDLDMRQLHDLARPLFEKVAFAEDDRILSESVAAMGSAAD